MHIVIVGGGLTGGTAAKTLREAGFDGDVTILGDEPGPPFGRPPLSKTYLRGEEDLSGWTVDPPDVELDNEARVERIEDHQVVVAGGRKVAFDKLLIATGSRPRRADTDLDGVFTLRTKADADAIKARAHGHAVVIGMSFIGCEVAASLRQLGVEVTAVFPGAGPLAAVLGDQVAKRMTAIHEAHGVELHANERLKTFEGDGKVEAVVTESGRRIECDLAIVGIGVQPNVEFLEGSGVATDNGVLVDAACRTNVGDVFAAGDVANHDHPIFGRMRIEHYNNAEKQGRHAALVMLGETEPYDYFHSFWSDQYEHKLEYIGHTKEWDDVVVRGDPDGAFIGLYLKKGVVKAAMGLDRGGDPEADPDAELAEYVQMIRDGARLG